MKSLALTLAILLTGCAPTRTLIITSDTRWSGAVGNSTHDGYGDARMSISGDGIICWVIQKQTAHGTISAHVEVKHSITGTERHGRATTSAQYGIVSGCSE